MPHHRPSPPSRCRRNAALTVAATLAVVAAACVPPPPPPPPPQDPTWATTHLPRVAGDPISTNHLGAWTNDDWFATVDPDLTTGAAQLSFRPRSGPGNSELGAPQQLPVAPGGITAPRGGGSVVALPTTVYSGSTPESSVALFAETDGVWAPAGSVPLAEGEAIGDLTDDWLVIRRVPGYLPSTVDGSVVVYSLVRDGATIDATHVTTLGPDPTWPQGLRAGFGIAAAVDGDLLAVGAADLVDPVGWNAVRVFDADGGGWQAVHSIGSEGLTTGAFGRAVAVSDGEVRRVVVGPVVTPPMDAAVEVHADDGTGWALEQSIERDPDAPDETNGLLFGASFAVDGELLALSTRSELVPREDTPGAGAVAGIVEVHHFDGTDWVPETEFRTSASPVDGDVLQALPWNMQLSGTHLAVGSILSLEPPPGCIFPCFSAIAFEAWSFDRL